MKRRPFLTASLSLPWVLSAKAAADPPSWRESLEAIRARADLPALGAALVTTEGEPRLAVVGRRRRDAEGAASPQDFWHIGSNTKAMTATLAAQTVEAGRLDWDTPLAELLPKRLRRKSPLAGATLQQLLSHGAGLPANAPWQEIKAAGGDLRAQRERVVELALASKEASAPGSAYLYSNWGYVVAGALLEQAWNRPWEKLMEEKLFAPLGMERAGFGGTGSPGQLDQPWPHREDGRPLPQNGPEVDNAAVLGPAGTVHLPLADWARFVSDQLLGPSGRGRLLKAAESYQKLHQPVHADPPYAFGWIVLQRDWGGRVLTHAGSNTMNQCVAWLAPERGFALLAVTNQGGETSARALDEAVSQILKEAELPPAPNL